MPLQISSSKERDIVLVSLEGTMVGPQDREDFQKQIEDILGSGETCMILDMGEVTYADSSGIGALVGISNLVMRKGACMKLLNVTKRIHDVLQITRLSSVFAIYDNLDKAIASFETIG